MWRAAPIIILVLLTVSPAMALAPHPVYFSVDGSPAEEEVEVEGKHYLVRWDGSSLSMVEVNSKAGGNGNGNGNGHRQGSYRNRISKFYKDKVGGNGNGRNGNNGHDSHGGNGNGRRYNGHSHLPPSDEPPDGDMPWWGGLIWLGILAWGVFVYYVLWKLGILVYVFIGMIMLLAIIVTWLNLTKKGRW